MKASTLRKYAPVLVIILVVIAGAAAYFRPSGAPYLPPSAVEPQPPSIEEPIGGPGGQVSQSACVAAGGRWNECGSACRTAPPGTACIQVCVPYCECASTNQCPSGTRCGEYIKGTGVCN